MNGFSRGALSSILLYQTIVVRLPFDSLGDLFIGPKYVTGPIERRLAAVVYSTIIQQAFVRRRTTAVGSSFLAVCYGDRFPSESADQHASPQTHSPPTPGQRSNQVKAQDTPIDGVAWLCIEAECCGFYGLGIWTMREGNKYSRPLLVWESYAPCLNHSLTGWSVDSVLPSRAWQCISDTLETKHRMCRRQVVLFTHVTMWSTPIVSSI